MAAPVCSICELHAESTFKIEGMDCREEVEILERRFKHLAGLEDFSADLMGQRLHVKYDAAKLSTAVIADAVADTGMRAWREHEEPIGTEQSQGLRSVLMWTCQFARAGARVPVLDVSRCSEGAGRRVARRRCGHHGSAGMECAARAVARHQRAHACRGGGAVVIDQWFEAATVVFLFAVAQILEARTVGARPAIRALMDLTPRTRGPR
jgi:Cd2+/Zn2+-exporting ATPase